MTGPREDDHWVTFWQQHRPVPPSASPDLEDRIVAAIEAESSRPQRGHRDRTRRRRWALPAIAASLLLSWGGWTMSRPTLQAGVDIAERDTADLNTFLTETWYDTSYGDDTLRLVLDTTEPDWLFAVYATPY